MIISAPSSTFKTDAISKKKPNQVSETDLKRKVAEATPKLGDKITGNKDQDPRVAGPEILDSQKLNLRNQDGYRQK